MAGFETLFTFGIYMIFLIGIGVYFYNKTNSVEDYLIGGRGMGSWVTALSAQASDMSGWLLMGLPGAVYISGMNQAWIAIGLLVGTYLNWKLVAPRLRVQTEETDTMTISTFLEKKLGDNTGLIRNFSAIVTLFFFTIYSSSGLVAAGKLFESMLGIDYKIAVIVGAVTIVTYTFMGGYLASCWTDFFQGGLMFAAIIVVPLMALNSAGGTQGVIDAMAAKNISMDIFSNGSEKLGAMAIFSSLAWGLGYFGQPHILVRFMSINSVKDLKKSRLIAMIWVIISLGGAIAVGLAGIAMFKTNLDMGGDSERVFIYMISKLFNPWIGGILLAAILSAIMSTIDSQLLVSSTTLTEDFYKYIKKDVKDKELMWVGRFCVIGISLVSVLMALNPSAKVLALVSYAWGGFGAVFGPAILTTLYFKNINWKSVFMGMVTGMLVLVTWKHLGYDSFMYEIVPGFIANGVVTLIGEKVFFQEKTRETNELA
ncbi:sodium/proline symporter PutP [uncultured Ilyobacter sp.]|uniref:sodium/proline symporter PutP n=1 Tax=uncultured Ilyobacter sp. TaxID=544433 RepID=UPI0029C8D403|nr:sodium/proline symporter PutP [uncultured Ilyobacter sp.]